MLPTAHLTLLHWHYIVSLYDVMLALGVSIGILLAVRRASEPDVVMVVATLAAVAGVAAADGWHRALHASPGLSSMGGIAGALVAIAVAARVARVPARHLLDAMAPGALAGFAIGRVGCLLAGCCYGRVTSWPWGIVLPSIGPDARHPVQLLEAVLDVAVACWCARATASGLVAARAAIGYAAVRMLLEPLRDPAAADVVTASGVSAVPWGALGLVVLGVALAGRPREWLRLDGASRSMRG
jgi:phosphatidylglycerol:prolipoprotein diacylglycerol transferase